MLDGLSDTTLAAAIGFGGGLALGVAARLGRFCTLGAIEDRLYGGDDARLRMWGVALGVAILGTAGLVGTGLLDATRTVYLTQAWNPAASILGGLIFGYGMALSGNCGYGALARLGGGDIRSFLIVIVMGLGAYMTVSGPVAYLRVFLFPEQASGVSTPGFAQLASRMVGLPEAMAAAAAGIVLLALAVGRSSAGRSRAVLGWGTVVGLAIVSGWAGTAWLERRSFDAVGPASHTFSAPVGETLLYAMIASGQSLSFGIGSVLGVVAGAFAACLAKGHFRWEACDDPRELRRQILGAFIMGVGAVTALGCSVGQGLSAFSVLAFSAPVTLAAIFLGAAIGLRQLITGLLPAAE